MFWEREKVGVWAWMWWEGLFAKVNAGSVINCIIIIIIIIKKRKEKILKGICGQTLISSPLSESSLAVLKLASISLSQEKLYSISPAVVPPLSSPEEVEEVPEEVWSSGNDYRRKGQEAGLTAGDLVEGKPAKTVFCMLPPRWTFKSGIFKRTHWVSCIQTQPESSQAYFAS